MYTFTLMAHCTSGAIRGSVSCARTLRQGIEPATFCLLNDFSTPVPLSPHQCQASRTPSQRQRHVKTHHVLWLAFSEASDSFKAPLSDCHRKPKSSRSVVVDLATKPPISTGLVCACQPCSFTSATFQ